MRSVAESTPRARKVKLAVLAAIALVPALVAYESFTIQRSSIAAAKAELNRRGVQLGKLEPGASARC
jgi:hypothetical protein